MLVALVSSALFSLLLVSSAPAATYYVDNAVAASGNGTSWATAWKSFSHIAWSALKPGDTLFISGGSTSKTYTETLTVGASGTASSAITISPGIDSGHKGTVIIDGQMKRSSGVDIDGDNYITVRGLDVKNHIGEQGQIRVFNCTGARIENNDLYVTGHGGVFIQNCAKTTISGNTIKTPSHSTAQTDGIYSQRNKGGNVYEHNTIVISNNEQDGHDDCIQLYQDASTVIRGNYCEQNNTKTYNAQGFWMTDNTGTIEVYDNTIHGPHTGNALIGLGNVNSGNARLVARNNTLTGSAWGSIWLQHAPNSVLQDNTVESDATNATLVRITGATPAAANVDNNSYSASKSSSPFWLETSNKHYNWSTWRQLGYDAHGTMSTASTTSSSSQTTYALTASPSSVSQGQSTTATWKVTSGNANAKDWIGLYKAGTSNRDYLAWTYTNGALSGTFTATLDTPGTYEFRYLVNDGYTHVAQSSAIVVK